MDEYVDGKNDIPADENTIEPHEAAQYVMEDGEETREKKGEWLSKMMPFKPLHVVQSVQVWGGGGWIRENIQAFRRYELM